jgi:hypothetical protein
MKFLPHNCTECDFKTVNLKTFAKHLVKEQNKNYTLI